MQQKDIGKTGSNVKNWISIGASLRICLLSIIATLSVWESVASAEVVWQIGRLDGEGQAINGATEYPATGAFWAEFRYDVGTDIDPINTPSCPGYLYTTNVCNIDPYRPCTDTAGRLIIRFSVDRDYNAGELHVQYGRYGSELASMRQKSGRFEGVGGACEEVPISVVL